MVSVVVLNWNGKKHLSYCLPSLEKIDYPNFEIILVDNASTDDSVEFVRKNFPQVKIIKNKKNLGFAQANNIGFKNSKGKYVLFLNNDTKVRPSFLTKLVRVLKSDKKIGVVQPKIVFMGSKRLQAGGSFLTRTGFLYHFGYGKDPNDKKYNQAMEIFSANGSCMLVKREVVDKVGLFDEDFFIYFEESDFCWRVWLADYKIFFVPQAMIYHQGTQDAKSLTSMVINFLSFKNRIQSLIKNLGPEELFKILPIHLLLSQLACFVFLITAKFSQAGAIQKAIGWNLWHLNQTLKKRRKIQSQIRQVSDQELMPKIRKSVRPAYYYYLFTGLERYED